MLSLKFIHRAEWLLKGIHLLTLEPEKIGQNGTKFICLLGNGVVGQWVKLLPAMPATHIGVPVGILDDLLEIQIPVSMFGKAVEDGLGS